MKSSENDRASYSHAAVHEGDKAQGENGIRRSRAANANLCSTALLLFHLLLLSSPFRGRNHDLQGPTETAAPIQRFFWL